MQFERLERAARARVEEVRNDPWARHERRAAFYQRFGFGRFSQAGFGASELAFMRWEIERGALNRLDDPGRPGSPYWRATNECVAYCAELAVLICQHGGPSDLLGVEVRSWLDYFANPSAQTWYRAHNASLIWGMIRHKAEALAEPPAERLFINGALYRLLYAEALVNGALFGAVARWVCHPELFAVQAVLRLSALYPRDYPARAVDAGSRVALIDQAARRLFVKLGWNITVLSDLVERYLVPLMEGHLANAEIGRRFIDGLPLYPQPFEITPAALPFWGTAGDRA